MDGADIGRRFASDEEAIQSVRQRIARFEPGPGSAITAWPPALTSPFGGPRIGTPEIDASALTPETMGAGIVNHGALIVRNLIPAGEAAMLRQGVDRALAACAPVRDEGQPPNGWYAPAPLSPHIAIARRWVETDGAVLTADCPFMLDAVIAAFKRTGIIGLIEAYLGEAPALSIGKSTLRRVRYVPGHMDWHQDGAFLGSDVRAVNVWLALSECGVDAPGLDIVSRRLPYVVQTGSHGSCFDWSVGNGMVAMLEEGGAEIVSPRFSAGDALLFDELMLHRTGYRPHMTQQRWAIESWFFASSRFPVDQAPLSIL